MANALNTSVGNFLRNPFGKTISPTTPAPSGMSSLNASMVPTSNSGATAPKPTVITPPATTTPTSSLPPAGQTYAQNLYDTTTGARTDYGTNQGAPNMLGGKPVADTTTTPPATTPPATTDPYTSYLQSLSSPDTLKAEQANATEANQRLADIQNQSEEANYNARREKEAYLNREGTGVGANATAANEAIRRSGPGLADLALRESAAARTAGVATDTLNTGLGAGKSLYDIRNANIKPISVNNQTYQFNPNTNKYEAMANSSSVGGVGGLSDTAVNFWAQAGASGVSLNSLIPSLGMGSAAVATKQALLEKMATNATTLGIDGSTFGAMLADSKAKTAAYTKLQAQGSQTKVNEDSANKYFDTLNTLAPKVDASVSSPVLEGWIRSGQLALTGDSNTNLFLSQLTESLTEYAKVMSGQTTGAGVAQFANEQAKGLLDKGLSAKAIKDFTELAKQNMSNRTGSFDSALKGLFGNIKTLTDTSGGLGTGDTSGGATGDNSAYAETW